MRGQDKLKGCSAAGGFACVGAAAAGAGAGNGTRLEGMPLLALALLVGRTGAVTGLAGVAAGAPRVACAVPGSAAAG